jgi:hypothetical protein
MSWAGEVGSVRDWFSNSYRFDTQGEAECFIQQLSEQWIPAGFVRAVRVLRSSEPVNARWDFKKQDAIRLDVVIEEETPQAKYIACRCNHDAAFLQQQIAAGHPVHKFEENEIGEYVLICLTCEALWDHTATDKVIESVIGKVSYYDMMTIPENLPIFEPWERRAIRKKRVRAK